MVRLLDRLTRRRRKRQDNVLRMGGKTQMETRRPLGETHGLIRDWRGDPQQIAGVLDVFKPLVHDPAAIDAMDCDEIQLPAVDDREGYYPGQHLNFWLSGLADLRVVQGCVPATAFSHVLDFGGASGRFARHVILADPNARVTVTDLNINHVEWIERYFGPAVRGVKVSPYPHFPLADRSVTLCVGFSVFTHIDSYESGWLAEIDRVLAADGYAVLTIHSEDSWPLLPQYTQLFKTLNKSPGFDEVWQRGTTMDFDRLAFDYIPNSIEHNCNVFMHSRYVRRVWGKWFEVVDVLPRGHHGFQAMVVLRKRRA